jgi:dCMP deaminase
MPSGWDNECEELVYRIAEEPILKTKPEVLHAETNAIAKLAKSNESGLGATMFVTHAPCLDCAKLIYQSGISSVLYRNAYRDTSGVAFLEKSGIRVTKIETAK